MRAYPGVSRRAHGKTIEYGTATPKEIQLNTQKNERRFQNFRTQRAENQEYGSRLFSFGEAKTNKKN